MKVPEMIRDLQTAKSLCDEVILQEDAFPWHKYKVRSIGIYEGKAIIYYNQYEGRI